MSWSSRLEGGESRVFVEVLRPPLRLVVCGAGHDAIPLVRAGAQLGWRVDVVDDRASFLDAERFRAARSFIECEPGEVTERANLDERSYVVVMSHNYLRDRDYLRSMLPEQGRATSACSAPTRAFSACSVISERRGFVPTREQLERTHGPAGLDLGGEGPEEIATAIVAEILAVSEGREAGFLRRRSGPIHERPQPTNDLRGATWRSITASRCRLHGRRCGPTCSTSRRSSFACPGRR